MHQNAIYALLLGKICTRVVIALPGGQNLHLIALFRQKKNQIREDLASCRMVRIEEAIDKNDFQMYMRLEWASFFPP